MVMTAVSVVAWMESRLDSGARLRVAAAGDDCRSLVAGGVLRWLLLNIEPALICDGADLTHVHLRNVHGVVEHIVGTGDG